MNTDNKTPGAGWELIVVTPDLNTGMHLFENYDLATAKTRLIRRIVYRIMSSNEYDSFSLSYKKNNEFGASWGDILIDKRNGRILGMPDADWDSYAFLYNALSTLLHTTENDHQFKGNLLFADHATHSRISTLLDLKPIRSDDEDNKISRYLMTDDQINRTMHYLITWKKTVS